MTPAILRSRAESLALSLTPSSLSDTAPRRYFYEEIEGPAYLGASDDARAAYRTAITIPANRENALRQMNLCLARGEYPDLPVSERRRRCYNDAIEALPQHIDWHARLPRPVAPGRVAWSGSPLSGLLASWTHDRYVVATKEYSVNQYLSEKFGPIVGAVIESAGEMMDPKPEPLIHWTRWGVVLGAALAGIWVVARATKRGDRGRG